MGTGAHKSNAPREIGKMIKGLLEKILLVAFTCVEGAKHDPWRGLCRQLDLLK